jgi:hypothetical protein
MRDLVIISGDSWSIDTFHRLDTIEFYPPYYSLARSLERKNVAHTVVSWGEQGWDVVHCVNRILKGIENYDYTDYWDRVTIVYSWTDWSRIFHRNVFSKTWGNLDLWHPDYIQARDLALDITQQELNKIPSDIRVLHWGGHAVVDKTVNLGKNHTVMYTDYCAHLGFKKSTSTTGTLSWPDPTLELFPDTDPHLANTIDKKNKRIRNNQKRRPKEFPDGGHLNWRYYDKLVDTIAKYF